jgi:hypothetical protein
MRTCSIHPRFNEAFKLAQQLPMFRAGELSDGERLYRAAPVARSTPSPLSVSVLLRTGSYRQSPAAEVFAP